MASKSVLVCWRCGEAVYDWHAFGGRGAYKHALGGKTGAMPKRLAHKPVPILRGEFDRCFAWDTPVQEARAIADRMSAEDERINGNSARGRAR